MSYRAMATGKIIPSSWFIYRYRRGMTSQAHLFSSSVLLCVYMCTIPRKRLTATSQTDNNTALLMILVESKRKIQQFCFFLNYNLCICITKICHHLGTKKKKKTEIFEILKFTLKIISFSIFLDR